ncbi:MAG: VTT domain-containing protein [Candidatus Bathyarchaeota archaeon]|nr:VTT domain-containing protein [Candidatus Bathyarchaeota archaeon]
MDWFEQMAVQFGFLGVFFISLVGTMAIIVPIPYTLVIFLLGKAGWDPILLMIAGGSGSAIGELVGYLLGYYGRRLISHERQRKMDYLLRLFGNYTPVAIFLFALTPLPDDLLFIPLGLLKYSLLKAFIPALLGKFLMIYLVAYFGKIGDKIIESIFGTEGSLIGSIITTILLITIVVALYLVDWERVLAKFFKEKTTETKADP